MRPREYTARGIRRCKCARCGEQASQSWTACAIDNWHMPLCTRCDVGLNRVALEYVIGKRRAKPLLSRYAEKMRAE